MSSLLCSQSILTVVAIWKALYECAASESAHALQADPDDPLRLSLRDIANLPPAAGGSRPASAGGIRPPSPPSSPAKTASPARPGTAYSGGIGHGTSVRRHALGDPASSSLQIGNSPHAQAGDSPPQGGLFDRSAVGRSFSFTAGEQLRSPTLLAPQRGLEPLAAHAPGFGRRPGGAAGFQLAAAAAAAEEAAACSLQQAAARQAPAQPRAQPRLTIRIPPAPLE